MGPRSSAYITQILVTSHASSIPANAPVGKWHRAQSVPNTSGNLNDGELGRYIYLWFETSEKVQGDGFSELRIKDSQNSP